MTLRTTLTRIWIVATIIKWTLLKLSETLVIILTVIMSKVALSIKFKRQSATSRRRKGVGACRSKVSLILLRRRFRRSTMMTTKVSPRSLNQMMINLKLVKSASSPISLPLSSQSSVMNNLLSAKTEVFDLTFN